MSITTRRAVEKDLELMVGVAVASQAVRATHSGLFPTTEPEIRASLAELEWLEHGWVAEDGGTVVAWVTGEHSGASVRWVGPFAPEDGWAEGASAVLGVARESSRATVEVIHADNRNYHLTGLATELGFSGSDGIVEIELETPLKDSIVMVHPMKQEFREFVSMFHEASFPDSEVVGADIVEAEGPNMTMVIRHSGQPVGYINTTRESETTARINFVAVEEAARRKRLGGEMVRAATTALVAEGISVVRVEVGDENEPARELFRSLGFTEQRLVIPFNR